MKNDKELETLIAAHWGYVESVLNAHGVDRSSRQLAEWEYRCGFVAGYRGYPASWQKEKFHYKTAYEHGQKHAAQDRESC
jgi:hypothetical protein